MKKRALVYLSLFVVFSSLLLTGCSFTQAWFKKPYLNGNVTEEEAVADINEYISKDVKNGSRLKFQQNRIDPITSMNTYTNDAGLELSFESGSGHIQTIIIAFLNNDQNRFRDAETLTRIICEMIDPMAYILNSNTERMLNHMNIGSKDFNVYVFENSNNTVEKIAANDGGMPVTMIRFRPKIYKTLKTFSEEIAIKALSNPMFWLMFE